MTLKQDDLAAPDAKPHIRIPTAVRFGDDNDGDGERPDELGQQVYEKPHRKARLLLRRADWGARADLALYPSFGGDRPDVPGRAVWDRRTGCRRGRATCPRRRGTPGSDDLGRDLRAGNDQRGPARPPDRLGVHADPRQTTLSAVRCANADGTPD